MRYIRLFPPFLTAALWLAVLFIGLQSARAASSSVIISAVYYDTYLSGEPDEAIRLTNISGSPQSIAGWTLGDGEGAVTLTSTLASGNSVWITANAISFTLEFGFTPDYEYASDSDPLVPQLPISGTLSLANDGDEVVLRDNNAALVDALVYENGNASGTDWSGAGIAPYAGGSFGIEGQVLYRKLNQATGQLVPDTDTASDWAQSTTDAINGRKVLYPGWDLEHFFQTAKFTETATLTYTIAPDNIYSTVVQAINAATSTIRYEGYDFENADLGLALAARASAGVSVTVLLEGGPVGGISHQERWICQQIETAGGACWFIINDTAANPPIHDRYAYQHAKFMLIDGRWALTGSENLNYTSMPADNKADGTLGNRGTWLWTDSPGLIAHAQDIWSRDFDPANHRDLRRWSVSDPTYGAPPGGFTPGTGSGGTGYAVQFPQPFVFSGTFNFEVVQSPDNALRDTDSLLGMVARAGAGDRVLVEQLYEHHHWGAAGSNPAADPNPRLEAYIQAARRGALVRLLLDSQYDDAGDPRSNFATCNYANAIAASESLDLQCRRGNPTGTGIHNKLVLVRAGADGWSHTGSINGSENSSKNNRELAVQVRSLPVFNTLSQVFWSDWVASGGTLPPPACEPGEVAYCIQLSGLSRYSRYQVTNLSAAQATANHQLYDTGGTQQLAFTGDIAGQGSVIVNLASQALPADYSGYALIRANQPITGVVLPPELKVYLPFISKALPPPPPTPTPTATTIAPTVTPIPSATPTVAPSNLTITQLSGTTTPEFVTIQNTGGTPQNMAGWTIVSVVGPQTYSFPADFTLAPGATVRVESYTGATENRPAVLFWTLAAMWNNAGDKAELRNPSGVVVSSACYGNACP